MSISQSACNILSYSWFLASYRQIRKLDIQHSSISWCQIWQIIFADYIFANDLVRYKEKLLAMLGDKLMENGYEDDFYVVFVWC